MRRLIAQLIKFGLVGGIAFCIDYGLMVFLTQICHVHYLISATISFTVALVFNFFASMRYVFRGREGDSQVRLFIVFATLSVIGLGLNDFIIWAGVSVHIDYRIAKIGASAIVMVYNFITRKLLIEGRGSQTPVVAPTSDEVTPDATPQS